MCLSMWALPQLAQHPAGAASLMRSTYDQWEICVVEKKKKIIRFESRLHKSVAACLQHHARGLASVYRTTPKGTHSPCKQYYCMDYWQQSSFLLPLSFRYHPSDFIRWCLKKAQKTRSQLKSNNICSQSSSFLFFFPSICLFSAVLGQCVSFYTCPTFCKALLGLYKDKRGWNNVFKILYGCWQCVRREEPSASQTPN